MKYSFIAPFLAISLLFQVLPISAQATTVKNNLFIQVENRGQAWYVHPKNHTRYLLDDNFGWSTLDSTATVVKDSELALIPVQITDKRGAILPSYTTLTDTDEDTLPDPMELALNTDPNAPDSDMDSYMDATEVMAGYDPLQIGRKMTSNNKVITKYLGAVLKDPKGFIWYVNPINRKRYLLVNSFTILDLTRSFGSGISNRNLTKIVEHKPTPKPNPLTRSTTPSEEPIYDCGIASNPDQGCWSQAFKACGRAKILSLLDLGSFGGTVGMQYTIIGPKDGHCMVESHFTSNPNSLFLNKSLLCSMNHTKSFTEAVQEIPAATLDACEGDLKPLLVSR